MIRKHVAVILVAIGILAINPGSLKAQTVNIDEATGKAILDCAVINSDEIEQCFSMKMEEQGIDQLNWLRPGKLQDRFEKRICPVVDCAPGYTCVEDSNLPHGFRCVRESGYLFPDQSLCYNKMCPDYSTCVQKGVLATLCVPDVWFDGNNPVFPNNTACMWTDCAQGYYCVPAGPDGTICVPDERQHW